MLHHLELYVSNLQRTADFYHWLLPQLGYEPFQQWPEGFSMKHSSSFYIVFVQAQEKHLDIPYHRSRVGMNHLAFYADSRAHVDAITAQLRERNVPILYSDRHPHAGGPDHYAVFFEDPDRIKVEIVAP